MGKMYNVAALATDRKLFMEYLKYNDITGNFIWIKKPYKSKKNIGDIAGSIDTKGYVSITVKHKRIKAHRLVFLFKYGYLPENGIDHKNGDKADNRICNLREAGPSCQQRNMPISIKNTSGFKGVRRKDKYGLYEAQIWFKGKSIYLGKYKSAIEAALARITWEDWCCEWVCGDRDNNREKLREAGCNV